MPTFKPYVYQSPATDALPSAPISDRDDKLIARIGARPLHTTVMLVQFTMGKYDPTMRNKQAEREIAVRAGISQSANRAKKELLPPSPELDAIDTFYGAAKLWMRERTLPYFDNKLRAMPNSLYAEVSAYAREASEEFTDLVHKFVAVYPTLLKRAPAWLGPYYDSRNYPSPNTIHQRFSFTFNVFPFPKPDDFDQLTGLPQADTNAIKQALRDSVEQQFADDVVKELIGRMQTVIGRMVERLNAYKPATDTDKVTGKFHDTLVSNIEDLITLVPTLNVTKDSNIIKWTRDMVELIKYHPDQLRSDEQARRETAAKAEAISKAMSQFI